MYMLRLYCYRSYADSATRDRIGTMLHDPEWFEPRSICTDYYVCESTSVLLVLLDPESLYKPRMDYIA